MLVLGAGAVSHDADMMELETLEDTRQLNLKEAFVIISENKELFP